LEELPERLLIVGAGAVGLELGQAFSRFGSQVTLVDALDEIAPNTDQHAAKELRDALEEEGIRIILGSFVTKVAARASTHIATIAPRGGGMEQEIELDRLLLASGCGPNIDELKLEAAGAEPDKRGVAVVERTRTTVPGS